MGDRNWDYLDPEDAKRELARREGDEPTIIDGIIRKAALVERGRCAKLARLHLLYPSQRAVSWHEVQDFIKALEGGEI